MTNRWKATLGVLAVLAAGLVAAPPAAREIRNSTQYPTTRRGEDRSGPRSRPAPGDHPLLGILGRRLPERAAVTRPLNEDQVRELLGVLKTNHPVLHERLARIRESQPVAYQRAVSEAWGWYEKWKALPPQVQQRTLQMQRDTMRIWRLSQEYHKAPDAATRDKLRAEMRQAAEAVFDADQSVRQHHLDDLSRRLEKIGRASCRERV